jgi:hypothetical protein
LKKDELSSAFKSTVGGNAIYFPTKKNTATKKNPDHQETTRADSSHRRVIGLN